MRLDDHSRGVDKVPERRLVEPDPITIIVCGGHNDASEQERTERYCQQRSMVMGMRLTWWQPHWRDGRYFRS